MISTTRNILAIGATGKVGTTVVEHLATTPDIKVIAGGRDVTKARAQISKHYVAVVKFDLDNRQVIDAALSVHNKMRYNPIAGGVFC
jgi:saccharopine dehydrogenase-like NADP-dependent oxidoreductase